MVVFTCTHCGESLQKPRVEKHYQTTCKNHPIVVSCMDCFKDFKMQEYAAHVKCVSEEERYAAKGTVMNPKKGEVKQTSWIETVNAIIEKQKNAKPEVRKLLEMLSKHSNVPRKKNRFVNFMNSATGGSAKPEDVDAVWELLEAHKPPAQDKNKEESASPQKKKKANKSKEEAEVSEAPANAAPAPAPAADTEQKPAKKKKADKKADDKNASESEPAAAAASDKAKSAKRKKRKVGEAEDEAAPASAPAPADSGAAPAPATATNASTQNGDVPKKKKKTTTPAADSAAATEPAKKDASPKKKKNAQPAATAGENADPVIIRCKKKGGDDKADGASAPAASDDKTSAKKKKDKSKSVANGEAAADAKKAPAAADAKKAPAAAGDADKKKAKKEKESGDKPVKSNWEEAVRAIVKGKPGGLSKDELIEQLFLRQAAAGEQINSKSKLRKHIIKLLYKMPELKVDKDTITPAN